MNRTIIYYALLVSAAQVYIVRLLATGKVANDDVVLPPLILFLFIVLSISTIFAGYQTLNDRDYLTARATLKYAKKLGAVDIVAVSVDPRTRKPSFTYYYYGWLSCLVRLIFTGHLLPIQPNND